MQWCDATVQPYGDSRPAQLKSLRKKIAEHKESKIHKLLSKILLKRSDDVLPHMMQERLSGKMRLRSEFFARPISS